MKNTPEIMTIHNIIDTWYLNKINIKQLQLGKTIASGGQGKTKIGKYFSMKVVVKILHKLNIESFLNEILISYKFRHPNIPKLIGIFESANNYGIVFEFIEGYTLSKIISLEKKKKIKLNLLQKLDYLIQLANVVEFLHSRHLIHRDLKTDNIIIDHLGNLKLLDFGISILGNEKWINMNSPEYSLTPSYIAPEIALQAQEADEFKEKNEEHIEGINLDYPTAEKITFISKTTITITKYKFDELTKTERYKYSNDDDSKWILISNKYDVWTFGIIMAQFFTRCRPWCKNEKETISEYDAQNRIISLLPYPIHILLPEEECRFYENELKTIIQKCLIFDSLQRVDIAEVKSSLYHIYKKEILHIKHNKIIYKTKQVQNQNLKIYKLLQSVDNRKKKQIVRLNKLLIRKLFVIEDINLMNKIGNTKDRLTNTFKLNDNYSKLFELIQRRKMEEKKRELIDRMLDNLKKLNLKKAQKLAINKRVIQDLKFGNNKNNK